MILVVKPTLIVLAVTCLTATVEADTEVSENFMLKVTYMEKVMLFTHTFYLLLGKTHPISVTISPVNDSQMVNQTCYYSWIIYLQA